jgi:hypothetical protein
MAEPTNPEAPDTNTRVNKEFNFVDTKLNQCALEKVVI